MAVDLEMDDAENDDDEADITMASLLGESPSSHLSELDHYRQVPLLSFKKSSLQWWKNSGHMYPKLSKLAKVTHFLHCFEFFR